MTDLLFTVGHHASYERYFREQVQPEKLGRVDALPDAGKPYPGGSVFLSFDEALAACPDGFRPYGLLTSVANTYEADGRRHLQESVPLCRLDDNGRPLGNQR